MTSNQARKKKSTVRSFQTKKSSPKTHSPPPEEEDDDPIENPGSGAMNDALYKSRSVYISKRTLEGLEFDEEGIPELDEFDITDIMLDATIVEFGKRRTGKSTLTRHLCYHYLQQFFPRGLVISQTDHLNKFFQDFVPEKFIYPELEEGIQQALLDFQSGLLESKDHKELEAEDENYCKIFIIYDDVIQDENAIRFSKPLRTIFVNGRHYKILSILNTQYATAIPPTMRDNVDIAFMFAASSMGSMDHLYKCFGGGMTKPMFYALLDKYTQDFGCLVYNNQDANEKSIKKKFFHFKADKTTPAFRMGSPAFWDEESGDFNDERYEKQVGFDDS